MEIKEDLDTIYETTGFIHDHIIHSYKQTDSVLLPVHSVKGLMIPSSKKN